MPKAAQLDKESSCTFIQKTFLSGLLNLGLSHFGDDLDVSAGLECHLLISIVEHQHGAALLDFIKNWRECLLEVGKFTQVNAFQC